MVIVLKRAILRLLKQRGYVLLKNDEYNVLLKNEYNASYFKRIVDLEEHNRQLTEAAAEQAARAQTLDRDLVAFRTEIATKDYPRLEAERAFYSKRVIELEDGNRQLTEAAAEQAARAQTLDRDLVAL